MSVRGPSGRARPARRAVAILVAVFSMTGTLVAGASPAAAQDRPLLREGSSGDTVQVLEQRLVDLGFSAGAVDTSFDAATREGVLAFQRAAGIGVDGIVGPITWGALDRGVQNPGDDNPPPSTPPPDPGTPPPPDPDPPTDTPSGRPLLRQGSSGSDVLALEQRLSSLGYWIASVDDTFDSGTFHAVVALQKAAGIGRDGVVGPITWGAVDAGTRPSAASTSGHVIEVDLSSQLLLVVDNGNISEIHDTSTGRVVGTTAIGTWSIFRQINGYRYAPLGVLYRPKYFYGGVAIHGYPSVPPYPASHGCVRLTNQSMDHLWAAGLAPIGTTVSVHP